jgi:hypothetical protein
MNVTSLPRWNQVRSHIIAAVPQFYELDSEGTIALDLTDDGWLLEIRPDGDLLCQHGVAMEDVKTLMCDGTTEDLGSDEIAKQAKFFLGPAVSKKRPLLLEAGFEEQTEMNDEYVAISFRKKFDFHRADEVVATVRWCQEQFRTAA